MLIKFELNPEQFAAAKSLVTEFGTTKFVTDRMARNCSPRTESADVPVESFWRALVVCMLSSAQRTQNGSNYDNFLKSDSYLLSYAATKTRKVTSRGISGELQRRGLRAHKRRGKWIADALALLKGGVPELIRQGIRAVSSSPSLDAERELARTIKDSFKGIGLKQSRNVIQEIGLSRYVVPIDSRFLDHLVNDLKFPVPIPTVAFQNREFYEFVEDYIQEVAKAAGVLPCVYDACVYKSREAKAEFVVADVID